MKGNWIKDLEAYDVNTKEVVIKGESTPFPENYE